MVTKIRLRSLRSKPLEKINLIVPTLSVETSPDFCQLQPLRPVTGLQYPVFLLAVR